MLVEGIVLCSGKQDAEGLVGCGVRKDCEAKNLTAVGGIPATLIAAINLCSELEQNGGSRGLERVYKSSSGNFCEIGEDC